MRTIFFGTPDLAVPSLAALAEAHEVAAVVCPPDRPKGRGKKLVSPPVKVWAEAHGIPVHQPAKLNDGAFEAWLREQAPDVCAVTAYGRFLKQPLLDIPPHGWLNVHPSLLPRWRGPSPIQSAVLAGDEEAGVTIIRLVLEMDAGDILVQESTPIAPEENAAELTARLADLGSRLLVEGMNSVAAGEAEFTPQDPGQVVVCPLFEKETGRIRWARPAREIHNLVRAAVPWPVAHCHYQGEVCRIHRTRVSDEAAGAEPGTVVAVTKNEVIVATGEGCIAILVFQAPGKKAIPMGDYLRGRRIEVGERFEDIG